MSESKSVHSTDAFLRLLKRSGILSDAQMQTAVDMAQQSTRASRLARRLLAKDWITRWQASQLLAGWHRLRLGNYRLCEQLDRADTGRVFRAEHMQLDRSVAIKTLARRMTANVEVVQQFLEDTRRASQLDHPNVLHVFDIDREGDQYYVVMEYIEGDDLQRLVEEHGPISADMVIEILHQLAAGTDYLHTAGIVHRDLRPANVMLDPQGRVKIVGVIAGSQADNTTEPPDLGVDTSPSEHDADPFCAPEQCANASDADGRADLYSIGQIARWMLSGASGLEAGNVVCAPTTAPADSVSSDERLALILDRLCATDRAHRFQSARELITALDGLTDTDAQGRPHATDPMPVGPELVAPCPVPDSLTAFQDGNCAATPSLAVADEPIIDPQGSTGPSADTSATPASPSTGAPKDTGGPGHSTARRALVIAAISVVVVCIVVGVLMALQQHGPPPVTQPQHRPSADDRPSTTSKSHQDHRQESRPQKPPTLESSMPEAGSGHQPKGPLKRPRPGANKTPKKAPPRTSAGTAKKPTTSPTTQRPQDPFRDLPAAVALPLPDDTASAWIVIGRMRLGPSTPCSCVLSAVDATSITAPIYRIQPASATAPRRWEISQVSSETTGTTVIAELRVRQSNLEFQWLEPRVPTAGRGGVVNCVLQFSSGRFTHHVRLRKPDRIRPLMVNLRKSSAETESRIMAPPDPSCLRYEVLALVPPLPQKYRLDPDDPIAVPRKPKTSLRLVVTDEAASALRFEFAPTYRSSAGGNGVFRAKCTACFQFSAKMPPLPMITKNWEEAGQRILAEQLMRNANAQGIRQQIAKMRKNDPKRPARLRVLERAETGLRHAAKATEQYEALQQLRNELRPDAAIHFRVFFTVGKCEVDLLRSDLPPEGQTVADKSSND